MPKTADLPNHGAHYKYVPKEQKRLVAQWNKEKKKYQIKMPNGEVIEGVAPRSLDRLIIDWCDGNVRQMKDFVIEFRP